MLLGINYNNGAGYELEEFESLAEAKETAIERAGLTGQAITIHGADGAEITRAKWFGIEPDEVDEEQGLVLCRFGTTGFYEIWDDEIENLFK